MLKRSIMFATVGLGSACVQMQPYTPPLDVALPKQFVSVGEGPTDPTGEPWWRSLGGFELERLLLTALASNRELGAAAARIDAARWDAAVAGAELWPEFMASLSGSDQEQITRGSFLGTERDRESRDTSSLGVTLRWEADLFGRLDARSRGAAERFSASAEDRQALELLVARSIAYSWVDIAHAVDVERLLSRQLDVGRRQLDLLRARQIVGRVTASEVLSQHSSLAELDAVLQEIHITRLQSTQRVAVLLGRAFTGEEQLGMSGLPALGAGSDPGRPDQLLTKRPDLRAAMHRVKAANADVAERMAERWPTLVLDLGAAFESNRPSQLFTGEVYSIVGQLIAPVFDGGRRAARVHREEASLRAIVEDAAHALLEAIAEVEAALVADRRLATAVQHWQDAARLARESWQLTNSRFLGGGGDALEAFVAWDRLLDVERAVLDLRREHARARVSLQIACGATLPRDEVDR